MPDGAELYAVDTYWEKRTRGERSDYIVVRDAQTLDVKEDIPLPAGRLLIVSKKYNFDVTPDGRYGGGGPSACPPGSSPSPTSWVGSCINPDDGKTYLIAYRDCCGKDSCGRCSCLGQEGDMPEYRPQVNNDIIWCFGSSSMVYRCSSAGLVGLAE